MQANPKRVAYVAHLPNEPECQGRRIRPMCRRVLAAGGTPGQDGIRAATTALPGDEPFGCSSMVASRKQYDTPGYRRHCRKLAKGVVDLVTMHQDAGYDIVIIGLDGSPSSGIRLTSTNASWGGRPEGAVNGGSERRPGMGISMEELKFKFEARGLSFPRATGVAMDAQDFNLDKAMVEFDSFLLGEEVTAT